MLYKINEIEGIGPTRTKELEKAGIETIHDLLEKGSDKAGREELALKTGFSASTILKWANMADLMRIKGIGEEYSELLELSGVDTVKELKHRVPEHLFEKMNEVNEEKRVVRRVPRLDQVERWVEEAKTLEPMISH